MKRAAVIVALTVALVVPGAVNAEEPLEMLIRTDDAGMSHTVNMGLASFIETGIPFSASVMTACPWYLEAVEILRDHPQVSAGIHLTLNSEWGHYKWGPVAGASRVPSLVDENGHFFATIADLLANAPKLEEVEIELRAQIERALRAGLEIDYFDYHMGAALSTAEWQELVERLAGEYGVGLARYFGEPSASLWDIAPEKKLSELLAIVGEAKYGRPTLVVTHFGFETPEMKAMIDLNWPADPYRVAQHRQAELEALSSPAFARAAAEWGITFVTYRDLVERHGLASMKRPQGTGYSMEVASE